MREGGRERGERDEGGRERGERDEGWRGGERGERDEAERRDVTFTKSCKRIAKNTE